MARVHCRNVFKKVAAVVPGSEARSVKKRHMTFIAGMAVLGVTAIIWAGRPQGPTALAAARPGRMPNLVNSQLAAAKAKLKPIAPSVTYSTRYVDFPAPAGTVVTQIPAVGAVLEPGAHITLIESNGMAPRHRPKKMSPAFFTGTGVYYGSATDGCGGQSSCSTLIGVQAWVSTDPQPDVLGVIQRSTCADSWVQRGDVSAVFQGSWYAQSELSIVNNCSQNGTWRIFFSKNN